MPNFVDGDVDFEVSLDFSNDGVTTAVDWDGNVSTQLAADVDETDVFLPEDDNSVNTPTDAVLDLGEMKNKDAATAAEDEVSVMSQSTDVEGHTTAARSEEVEATAVRKIAENETQSIQFWKLVIVSTILVATLCVTAGSFVLLRNENNDDYRSAVR